MPKFSIIVPVFNTEKYIKKCLDSVYGQNFHDFEVIVVNDGSTDGSMNIINKYVNKYTNIICYSKKNEGLSSARNFGVEKASGEYILFLDSDDYYSNGFFERLNIEIQNQDIIRFGVRDVFDDNNVIEYHDMRFDDLNGIESFDYLVKSHYVEIACAYCFKRKFWVENDFKFKNGTLHEDFGLIPLVLIKSKNTKCIDFIGYNYFQRNGSIIKTNDYEKILKKSRDFLNHFKYLIRKSEEVKGDLRIFRSYLANSVIIKSISLNGNDYKKYVLELKKLDVFGMLLDDTIYRKVKKFFIKISPKLYYKVVK